MTMTLESLARTIAKARHGTDAMWANYLPSARAVCADFASTAERYAVEFDPIPADCLARDLRAILAQPDGAQ